MVRGLTPWEHHAGTRDARERLPRVRTASWMRTMFFDSAASPASGRSRSCALPAWAIACALLASPPAATSAQTTERISVSSAGAEGDGNSLHESSISPDGRFVAFQSEATNLVGGDTNGLRDIFVRDRQTGTTTRVSVSSAGAQANAASFRPSISADGRWVAFESNASNLVAGDTNGSSDVFLHDRDAGTTTRRSVASGGAQSDNDSYSPSLSADGRWLAFTSRATTLDPLANNGAGHVFLHERSSGTTTLLVGAFAGGLENGQSGSPSVSAGGRQVAFTSSSSNLVAGGTSGGDQVYVRDLDGGTTTLVSVSTTGTEGNSLSRYPTISADGRAVAFQSSSSDLVAGDTNLLTDVFVRDLALGSTERVSVSSAGAQADNTSDGVGQPPGLSSDGRYVAYVSSATNLVPGTLGGQAVFLRDRALGQTSLLSLSTTNTQPTGSSSQPVMSADGRFVVFQCLAADLVPGDTNGLFDLFLRGPLDTTWANLGSGLAGVNGVPNLMGSGTLVVGTSARLELTSARASSLAVLLLALGSTPVPFHGGTVVPWPVGTSMTLVTDPAGALQLLWPAIPIGFSGNTIYWQFGILDPAAVGGAALSNALRCDVP